MSNSGSVLFQATKIGPLNLMNKFMRAPCYMHGCDNSGFPSPNLLDYYKKLADGQFGLITTGFMATSQAGKANVKQALMTTDRHAEQWKSTVDYIHSKGSKIIGQLCDIGGRGLFEQTRERPRGPSPYLDGSRAMTPMEISEVIEDFRNAAIRLQNAGFDGIQIHAAHGLLVSQFLSPYGNWRTDAYGGNPENRRRFLKEIVEAIRDSCGKDFFVGAKVNVTDALKKNGVEIDDCVETIKALCDKIDLFELSTGFLIGDIDKNNDSLPRPMSTTKEAAIIKQRVPKANIALAWGQRSFKKMEKNIESGIADLIALGKPSIADPLVVKHLKEGDKRVACISCMECLVKCLEGPVKCHHLK